MAKVDEDKIEYHYNRAVMLATELVEKEARRLMRKHKSLVEFQTGMGAWFFVDNKGNFIDEGAKVEPVAKIFDTWDEYFKLSGEYMRFSADSEIDYGK